VSAEGDPPTGPVLASPPKTRRRRFTVRRGLGLLASLVKLIAVVVFLLLVVYILFTVFGANPANPWTIFVTKWAQTLNLGLANLFVQGNPKIQVVINFGVPALIWLVVGLLISRLLRRI
jgi:hypothetical protein